MALKPQKLSWVEAASVPLSAITAWQALFERAGVKGLNDPNTEGKKVLIVAARPVGLVLGLCSWPGSQD